MIAQCTISCALNKQFQNLDTKTDYAQERNTDLTIHTFIALFYACSSLQVRFARRYGHEFIYHYLQKKNFQFLCDFYEKFYFNCGCLFRPKNSTTYLEHFAIRLYVTLKQFKKHYFITKDCKRRRSRERHVIYDSGTKLCFENYARTTTNENTMQRINIIWEVGNILEHI